ncbi:hypothetical protein IFM89_002709 [Coptis chinensis]|uniref:Uncharacterized protein n=1 Tax=Coptis chinensis TaxID=261450 RepID=A0A835IJ56_9MAGN|nr:hypothetical protein IFM89_002709 [Coptis chinensis]
MVSQGVQATPRSIETMSSPARISFSTNLFQGKNITTSSEASKSHDMEKGKMHNVEFEFFSSNINTNAMLPADELFFEGKLLPILQMEQQEKLDKITLEPKVNNENEEQKDSNNENSRSVSWYMDEDPSPRPPTCTVLWKELLNLKKHRARAASSLSPSPSSSSSSSSMADHMETIDEGNEGKEGMWNKEKHLKRIKKGLERTRSASFRIRPMVNVPVCTQAKNTALPSLFPLKKINVQRQEIEDR